MRFAKRAQSRRFARCGCNRGTRRHRHMAGAHHNPGFKTTQAAMLDPVAPGWTAEPIITVGETLPARLQIRVDPGRDRAEKGRDGKVEAYVNHETSTVPVPVHAGNRCRVQRLHGLATEQADAEPEDRRRARRQVRNSGRGELPAVLLQLHRGREHGFDRPVALHEARRQSTGQPDRRRVAGDGRSGRGSPGRRRGRVRRRTARVPHDLGLGRYNHENSVAIPGYRNPVILSTDDTFISNPVQSQLYSTSPTTGAMC